MLCVVIVLLNNAAINSNCFSIQPNATTREKQLEAWAQLVLHYCHQNNIYTADITQLGETELFYNRNLNRNIFFAFKFFSNFIF